MNISFFFSYTQLNSLKLLLDTSNLTKNNNDKSTSNWTQKKQKCWMLKKNLIYYMRFQESI